MFQCQYTSDQSGQVYTPNIPDLYFDPGNAAAFSMGVEANCTITERGLTSIFTLPAESVKRNCSGEVRSVQYCYMAGGEDMGETRTAFSLVTLIQRDTLDQFLVKSTYDVESTPRSSICVRAHNNSWYCCDKTPLDSNLLDIDSTEYVYGVLIGDYRLMAFDDTATDFLVEQFQASLIVDTDESSSDRFILAENNQLPLLRFILGKSFTTNWCGVMYC